MRFKFKKIKSFAPCEQRFRVDIQPNSCECHERDLEYFKLILKKFGKENDFSFIQTDVGQLSILAETQSNQTGSLKIVQRFLKNSRHKEMDIVIV